MTESIKNDYWVNGWNLNKDGEKQIANDEIEIILTSASLTFEEAMEVVKDNRKNYTHLEIMNDVAVYYEINGKEVK